MAAAPVQKTRPPGTSLAARFFYAVAVALIAASLVLLFNLQRSFEREIGARKEQVRRLFSDRDLIKSPSQPQIRFAAIEELAAKYEDDPTVRAFTITKFFGDEERVVYPYYLPALYGTDAAARPTVTIPNIKHSHPVPWDLPGNAEKLELRHGEELLGHLYLVLNQGPLTAVRAAIATLTGLLIGAVGLLAFQFRRQERVISRTTVELEEKRRELVRLERLAMAGQLSANILHDLKKPVLNIRHEADELDSRRVREQVDLFFGILRDSNLERFVQAQSEREYADVDDLLDRSLALVRYERKSVEVERRRQPEGLPPVFAEPVRLIQVFSNLILNAYQAMDGQGKLIVTSRSELAGGKPASGDHVIIVEIEDAGPGIPLEIRDHIFEPFYTTKPEGVGTGLGLYITRDILRDLGGTIVVSNVSPQGTRFTITLPAASETITS